MRRAMSLRIFGEDVTPQTKQNNMNKGKSEGPLEQTGAPAQVAVASTTEDAAQAEDAPMTAVVQEEQAGQPLDSTQLAPSADTEK